MTTEEKLQKFINSSMIHARGQAENIIREYNAAADKIFEDYKKTREGELKSQLKAEEERLRKENNRAISEEQIRIRREVADKQEELKEKLFEDINRQLLAYRQTPEYKGLLIKQIHEIMEFAEQGELIIYIDSSDAGMKAELEEKSGASLQISEYSFSGGTRAVVQGKNLLIDNSFETRLAEEKSKFTFQGGR